ncbi:MAG: glycosyltransferase family 4 protein [Fimbriimonadales bacterium]|nr:glycosyltransferase family 4 protein [Fimbriimonadales bacterium]
MRKGHILILVENLPVPFDRRVWMESLALTEGGYKVSVISPCPPQELSEPDKVLEGIHVFRYPMPKPTKSKLSFIQEFWYCYRQTKRLASKVWKSDKFDVIHSCNPPDTFWKIAQGYKRRGVKFVFDHHDLCPELYLSKFNRQDLLYRMLLWLERQQFLTADAVIATNESYKEIAIKRGGKDPSQVTVVRSGPLLSRFERVNSDDSLKRGRKHLGIYLGVMGPQDGVDYALRAIRHAIDLGMRDTTFAFIGSGDSYEDLIALSNKLQLDDFVCFTGRISDEELKKYLSTADFGIAPDPKNPLNDVSTMNKVVEYMAMSLPVVSFDLKESRFSAGEAAVYIANDDEKAMGAAMKALVADPEGRKRMGEIGRKRVESMLAWDFSKKVLVDFYDRLLDVNR